MQVSLKTPTRISLGEPILLHWEVENISGQAAALHIGLDRTAWCTTTLRDSKGAVTPAPLVSHVRKPSGAFSIDNNVLEDGKSESGYIAVGTAKALQNPGDYVLTLHVKLAYDLTSPLATGSPTADATTSGLFVVEDISFPIRVSPSDPNKLHATARALETDITNPLTEGSLIRAEMDGLFSMPSAEAATVWRDLALKPNFYNDLAASELEDLRSKTGVDILVQMLDTPGLMVVDPSNRLNELYNSADPALRAYITRVAASRGIVMPEVATTAIRLD